MSWSAIPTRNTIGVRRLYTLSGYRTTMHGLGTAPSQDTIDALVSAGYSSGDINTAVAFNVTDEQLNALPFPADASERAAGFQALMVQLTTPQSAGVPASQMQTSIPGYVYGAGKSAGDTLATATGQAVAAGLGPAGALIAAGSSGPAPVLPVSGPVTGAGLPDNTYIPPGVLWKAPGVTTAPGGTPPPPNPINWSLWLQQNFTVIVVGLAAIVILPKVIKKL
jgi:hypothetical protein